MGKLFWVALAHHVPVYQSRPDQWPSWNFSWHLHPGSLACLPTLKILAPFFSRVREQQGWEQGEWYMEWDLCGFLGFLLPVPPVQSSPVFQQTNLPSRAQCQRSPMSIDATVLCEQGFFFFFLNTGRQGGGHHPPGDKCYGEFWGGGVFDHSQAEKSFFHRSSLSLALAVGWMNSRSGMKV